MKLNNQAFLFQSQKQSGRNCGLSACCYFISKLNFSVLISRVLGSIVVSIPACHAGDRGSIPRRGGAEFFFFLFILTRALVIDISSAFFCLQLGFFQWKFRSVHKCAVW